MLDFTQCDWIDLTKLTRYHQKLKTFISDTYLNKSGGTMSGQINSCAILPKANNTYDLGSSSYKFKDGYFDGWLYATHFISANGNVRPSANGQGSIGTSSYYWGNAYLTNIYSNGTLYLKPGSGKTDYNQGIRITPHSSNNWASILLGGKDLSADTGTSAKSWFIANSDGVFGFYKNGHNTSANSYINCDSSGNWSMTGSLTNNSGFIGNLTGSATYATSAGSATSATSASSATNASNILQAYATANYNRPLLLSNITGTSTTSDVTKPTNFSNKFYANPSNGALTATGGFAGGGLRTTDTRSDNQNPQWYFTNYPSQTKTEFKRATSIGLPSNIGEYLTLMTIVPWGDNSGGYPVQLAFTNTREDNLLKVFKRTGTSNTAWSDWDSDEISMIDLKTLDYPVGEYMNITPKGSTTSSIALDSGVIDISGNGCHGTAVGGVSIEYDNDNGKCFRFDASAVKRISLWTFPITQNELTFSLRFKHKGNCGGSDGWNILLGGNWVICYNPANATLRFQFMNNSGSSIIYKDSVVSNITDGKWHTITCVAYVSNSTLYLMKYVDGIKIDETSKTSTSMLNGRAQWLGELSNGSSYKSNFDLAYFKLYPKVLTETQIKTIAVLDKSQETAYGVIALQKATSLDSSKLSLSGGTMTGTINSQNILPKTTANYNLGSSDYKWQYGYINYIYTSRTYVSNSIRPTGTVTSGVTDTNIGATDEFFNTLYVKDIISYGGTIRAASTNGTGSALKIGSSTYPVNQIYSTYINIASAGEIKPLTNDNGMIGTSLKYFNASYIRYMDCQSIFPSFNNSDSLLGNSSYTWYSAHIGTVNVNSVLPTIVNSQLQSYLGNSSYYWNYAYINNITSGNILPKATGTYDLGSGSYRWRHLFIDNEINSTDSITFTTPGSSGKGYRGKVVVYSTSSNDGLIIPYNNNTGSIGTSSYYWKNIYVKAINGTSISDNAVATFSSATVTSNGTNTSYVNIYGVNISGFKISVGKFTTAASATSFTVSLPFSYSTVLIALCIKANTNQFYMYNAIVSANTAKMGALTNNAVHYILVMGL